MSVREDGYGGFTVGPSGGFTPPAPESAGAFIALGGEIKKALSDDMRRKPWRGSSNPLAGHCYVASEALWHAMGRPSTWCAGFVRHEGVGHWYLVHKESGEVIDLTASQFETTVPYHRGRRCGFLTRRPSRRAQVVLDRVSGTNVG